MASILYKGKQSSTVIDGETIGNYDNEVLKDNPWFYIPFNNNITNLGATNSSIASYGTFQYQDHPIFAGKKFALVTPTNNNYVDIASNGYLDAIFDTVNGAKLGFTMECWAVFYSDPPTTPTEEANVRTLMCRPGFHNGLSFYAGKRINGLCWKTPSPSVAVFFNSPTNSIILNTWYHLAQIYNPTTGYTATYINGNLSASVTVANYTPYGSNPTNSDWDLIRIGRASSGKAGATTYTLKMDGGISHAAFYFGCLSASRIKAHYLANKV